MGYIWLGLWLVGHSWNTHGRLQMAIKLLNLRSWLYVEGLWPTSAVGCHLVRLQLHLVAFQDVPFSSVC